MSDSNNGSSAKRGLASAVASQEQPITDDANAVDASDKTIGSKTSDIINSYSASRNGKHGVIGTVPIVDGDADSDGNSTVGFNILKIPVDAAESRKYEAIYNLHEQYEKFGEDEIKDYLPSLDDGDGESISISLGELEKGSEASKNIGKTLSKMSDSMKDLEAPGSLQRSSNPIIRLFYDPVKAYFRKTSRAGDIITDCVKTLDKYQFALYSDIVTYRKDRVRAIKCAELSTQQADAAGIIIGQLRDELRSGRFDGDPELREALETEVLNTLERRRSDLLSIAANQTTYIASIDLLAKTHWKMIEQVKSTKNTAIIRLKSAVQVAHGIYVQETARKAIIMADEAGATLDMDNAVNLKESVKNINAAQKDLSSQVDSMQATLNVIIDAHKAFKDAEASSVELNHEATERTRKQLALLNKTIRESEIMDDTRNDLINAINDASWRGAIGMGDDDLDDASAPIDDNGDPADEMAAIVQGSIHGEEDET